MNNKMFVLLQKAGIRWPMMAHTISGPLPTMEIFDDCVLLKNQWEPNKQHVKITDLPDKTGFECFINHVHFPFDGSNKNFISCLEYAMTIQEALVPLTIDRQFRVIVALPEDEDDDCTIRFHQIRPDENWITEDLEGYKSEAILVFDVPSSRVPLPLAT